MGDIVTQSELNTVINNLNANIAENASAITKNLVGTANNLQTNQNGLQNKIINNDTIIRELITKNAFYVTTSDTDISPGGLFIKFINETRDMLRPYNLVPTKISKSMPREWRRLRDGTQLIQITAPIYLWFEGLSTYGGYLQDFFPFSSRTPEKENQFLYNLWELPTSTAKEFKSGPALNLFQADLDENFDGKIVAFPFVRNTGSILGQYNFEITGLESFRDKNCRILPNSVLSAALQNAGINFTQVVLSGEDTVTRLNDGTIDGAEYNSLLNNVDIGMLDQSGAQYCNTTICQKYLSVYLILVNATFWDSLTDEQREEFHTIRRNISQDAYASDISANKALLTQLRAGEFPGITESNLSEAATTELKTLTDAYINEKIDQANENYDSVLQTVYDLYTSTTQQELQNTLLQNTFDAQYEYWSPHIGFTDNLMHATVVWAPDPNSSKRFMTQFNLNANRPDPPFTITNKVFSESIEVVSQYYLEHGHIESTAEISWIEESTNGVIYVVEKTNKVTEDGGDFGTIFRGRVGFFNAAPGSEPIYGSSYQFEQRNYDGEWKLGFTYDRWNDGGGRENYLNAFGPEFVEDAEKVNAQGVPKYTYLGLQPWYTGLIPESEQDTYGYFSHPMASKPRGTYNLELGN